MRSSILVAGAAIAVALTGCQQSKPSPKAAEHPDDRAKLADRRAPRPAPQLEPPLPVAAPPADAETITNLPESPSAVVHLKRLRPGDGTHPSPNDTATVHFTAWRTSGETFLSTRSRNRPMQQNLATSTPGFAAAVRAMSRGERAMAWIPPALGYLGPKTAKPETTVYEIELIDFEPAPTTPPDLGAPPPTATRTPSGASFVIVKPGDGKRRARGFDEVAYHYTAWDPRGRIFDSSEVRRRPKTALVFHEPAAIADALAAMAVGERRRLWVPPELAANGGKLPAGVLTYELELLDVKAMASPPPVPRDVAAPPTTAKKTAHGVAYRVLKPGTGTVHPTATDEIEVHYTGWTTDGRLFESSIVRREPLKTPLAKMVPGWIEGVATMVAGETARFWIPGELAYRDQPGRPAGMVVFDIELLAITPASGPSHP